MDDRQIVSLHRSWSRCVSEQWTMPFTVFLSFLNDFEIVPAKMSAPDAAKVSVVLVPAVVCSAMASCAVL